METGTFKLFKKFAFKLRGRHLNRYPIVRATLNYLLRILGPKFVVVDGNLIHLDKGDNMRLSILGVYEPLMVEYFRRNLKRGDTILDIGAHIGYYTLIAAQYVGNSGKVYAFEPDKDNIALLSKNIKTNKYKNVVLVEKAVTDSTKKAKLFINPVSTGMHSLIDIDNTGSSILIDTISIDDFFGKNLPKVSVIKMDIEGGEYGALEGMRGLLRKNKHLSIFTEFSPFAIKKDKRSPRGFLNLLKYYGFKLYSIDESKNSLTPIQIDNFISACPVDRDWHINLMATKLLLK